MRRRMLKSAAVLVTSLASLAVSLPAAADGGWGFGLGLLSGTVLGAGLARPYYYYPPFYRPYYPATVVVQEAPPAYQTAAPPAAGLWYYCDAAQGYYPYVPSCPQPWRAVVPNVAPPAPR